MTTRNGFPAADSASAVLFRVASAVFEATRRGDIKDLEIKDIQDRCEAWGVWMSLRQLAARIAIDRSTLLPRKDFEVIAGLFQRAHARVEQGGERSTVHFHACECATAKDLRELAGLLKLEVNHAA